jgi:hypothetical protein
MARLAPSFTCLCPPRNAQGYFKKVQAVVNRGFFQHPSFASDQQPQAHHKLDGRQLPTTNAQQRPRSNATTRSYPVFCASSSGNAVVGGQRAIDSLSRSGAVEEAELGDATCAGRRPFRFVKLP